MIEFEHQNMASYKCVDFRTSQTGLSVGIKKVDDNWVILDTIENCSEWLSSCSAIVLISHQNKKAALYHYPAGKLKNNKEKVDIAYNDMIIGIGVREKIDEVFIYTGNLPVPPSHSITRYATEDVANIKTYLLEKGIPGDKLKGCFTEYGTAWVCMKDGKIQTGISWGGVCHSYENMLKGTRPEVADTVYLF